jgi:acyl-CoA synthetase (AMP-forming)/AMP-acid ligase II
VDTPRAYTYRALRDATIQFGSALLAEPGWKKDDVVAIFSPNDVDFPVVTWGAVWAGGVVSLVNSGYTASELGFQLVDSAATVLVTCASLLPVVLAAAKEIGFPHDKILLLGDEGAAATTARFRHFKTLRGGPLRSVTPPPHVVKPADDTCFIVYSSGTTGKPKGVMLTHRNIVANVLMLVQSENGNLRWNGGPDGRGDSIVGFLPFFHSYGMLPAPTFRLSIIDLAFFWLQG